MDNGPQRPRLSPAAILSLMVTGMATLGFCLYAALIKKDMVLVVVGAVAFAVIEGVIIVKEIIGKK